jgi:adenylate cyclase
MIPSILLFTDKISDIEKFKSSVVDCDVQSYSDLSQLQEVYGQHEFSLVILDADITGFDPYRYFSKMRSTRPWLSGILLSSVIDDQILRRIFQYGFSGFLERPLFTDKIQQTVKNALVLLDFQSETTRLKTLLPLYNLGEQFLSSSTEQEILDGMLNAVIDQVDCSQVSIMLYNEEDGCLKIVASKGFSEELVQSICVVPGDKISGWVYANGRPVILNKETQHQSIFAPLLKRPEIVSAVSVPMIIRGKIIGVLNLTQTQKKHFFSDADTELFAVICSQASLALENVRSLREREEKTRLRALFERYVTPEVAELLITREADLMDLGEIRNVTVLFADIRNFTSLVQNLSLTVLRMFLNEVYALFTDIVFLNKGMVDKFMGDAVLAVFGAPVELEKSSCSAARTALEIRERFQKLKEKWTKQNKDFEHIGLGIGITKGDMFLGNVGSVKRFDYTVIGTQVNIAQRLASESSFCEIYITEEVKKEIQEEYLLSTVGTLELRGVEKKLSIYKIESFKTC